ncbi:MAG TPA: NUDIX domain-containing protein [Arthrobacter sp.]|nr:NUDIX domain-containing protein [Arthrobacter sp.]
MTHRIALGILVRDGRVLLCHRSPARKWIPNVWDFPGGHIEKGETGQEALIRELWEELAISATVHTSEPDFTMTAEDVELSAWIIRAWEGTATNTVPEEHDDVAWVTLAEATMLQLADEKVLEWITLVLEE